MSVCGCATDYIQSLHFLLEEQQALFSRICASDGAYGTPLDASGYMALRKFWSMAVSGPIESDGSRMKLAWPREYDPGLLRAFSA